KRSITNRLLSSKTIAVPLQSPVHLLPILEWQGSSHLLGDPLKISTDLLWGTAAQLWVFRLNAFPQGIVQGRWIGLRLLEISFFKRFQGGNRSSPPGNHYKCSFFHFPQQFGGLVLQVTDAR